MKKNALSLMAVLVFLAGSPALALPISFDFSFHNYYNGSGDIAGSISGLEDNRFGQAAMSVVVTSNTLGYGLGEYVGLADQNYWDVVNGQITGVIFISFGGSNFAPDVVCCSLAFDEWYGFIGGLTDDPHSTYLDIESQVTFTPREVATVVVPAPFALIGIGILALSLRLRIANQ